MVRVRVFRNLHRDAFSVQARLTPHNGWRTVAWCMDALLSTVQMRVSLSGRARVLSSGRKGVHAFLEGSLLGWSGVTVRPAAQGLVLPLPPEGMGECPGTCGAVRYSPWEAGCFMHDGKPLLSADMLLLSGGRKVLLAGSPR